MLPVALLTTIPDVVPAAATLGVTVGAAGGDRAFVAPHPKIVVPSPLRKELAAASVTLIVPLQLAVVENPVIPVARAPKAVMSE